MHRNAQQMPDVSATIYGERSFTHAQTLDQVARLAASLPTYEVGSGDRVAILALNSDRYYQLLYATAWSGAVVGPRIVAAAQTSCARTR